MKKYLICNNGCDDSTDFEIELTNEELEIILKLIKTNNKHSSYGCQPTIDIYENYFYDDDGEPKYWGYVDEKFVNATSLLGENED